MWSVCGEFLKWTNANPQIISMILTMFNFLNKFHKLKKKFISKTPQQKWKSVRSVNIFLLGFVGCDIMDPNFIFNLKSFIPTYLAINYICLMFYTLYYYRYNPLKAMQSTPLMGLVVPVSNKLANNFSFFFM